MVPVNPEDQRRSGKVAFLRSEGTASRSSVQQFSAFAGWLMSALTQVSRKDRWRSETLAQCLAEAGWIPVSTTLEPSLVTGRRKAHHPAQ